MVNDGGSWGYNIVDALGNAFHIRFDRSFIIENGKVVGNQPGTIYISCPQTLGLVKVLDQELFRRIVLRDTEHIDPNKASEAIGDFAPQPQD